MRVQVTITGSGTSTGVPPIGWDPPEDFAREPRNWRLRSGLLVREMDRDTREARALCVDCGPDFRQQALTHDIRRLDGVLLTHAHFDHVAGMDDLRIYNFRQGHDLPLYGTRETLEDIRVRFSYCFVPQTQGGGVASFDLREVDGPFDFLGLRIVPIPAKHGSLDIIGYRFGDFVYMTDASAIPPDSLRLMEDCRVLVLNALRPAPHSTHFCLDEAVEVARSLGAGQTYFVHMTHHLEHNATNAILPAGMQLAWDGLAFEIHPRFSET
jgi:phosphoribosyl 1,2-cyclic phosphate phosphodiesterase